MKEEEFDDSPWTREELQALAWERVKLENWDEYDDLPEKATLLQDLDDCLIVGLGLP